MDAQRQELAKILLDMFAKATHIEEANLPPETYLDAKMTEAGFTRTVAYLRDEFPNPSIQRLGAAIWDAVGSGITPVALHEAVPTLSFTVIGGRHAAMGCILAPKGWTDEFAKDPIMQVGAVVFNGSQAVDYSRGKLRSQEDSPNLINRARAYEAEYLLTVRKVTPEWTPNEYQQAIMKAFPEGIKTPKIASLIYTF